MASLGGNDKQGRDLQPVMWPAHKAPKDRNVSLNWFLPYPTHGLHRASRRLYDTIFSTVPTLVI